MTLVRCFYFLMSLEHLSVENSSGMSQLKLLDNPVAVLTLAYVASQLGLGIFCCCY